MSNKHSNYNHGRGFINKAGKVIKETVKVIIGVRANDVVEERRYEMEFDDEDTMWAYIKKNPRRFLVGFLTVLALCYFAWTQYLFPSTEPELTDSPIEEVHNG